MHMKHPLLLKMFLKIATLHYIHVQKLFTYHRIMFSYYYLHIYTKGSCF